MKKPKILQSEHVFVAGRTGSGKTKLSKTYLAGYPHVIVMDTKGTFDWLEEAGEVPIYEHLAELMEEVTEGKAIYRPAPEEMNNEFYESFFEWIYTRKNCIVLVDELMSFATSSYVPFYLKAILTRGRERNTSVWCCTQRPKTIPIVCMSEASHFFIFSLNMDADRERIIEVCGAKEFETIPPKYQFWYYNVEMDKPVLAKLVIHK